MKSDFKIDDILSLILLIHVDAIKLRSLFHIAYLFIYNSSTDLTISDNHSISSYVFSFTFV